MPAVSAEYRTEAPRYNHDGLSELVYERSRNPALGPGCSRARHAPCRCRRVLCGVAVMVAHRAGAATRDRAAGPGAPARKNRIVRRAESRVAGHLLAVVSVCALRPRQGVLLVVSPFTRFYTVTTAACVRVTIDTDLHSHHHDYTDLLPVV